ncbi:PepSY domain-containing protein [Streptomyces canarius]
MFLRGNTPLTARLLKPALIDAQSGVLTDSRELPWYVATLLISQPLHFGDYGGMPLKVILRAILDLITIAVLVTGLYLWLRRRQPASLGARAPKLATSDRRMEAAS